MTQKQQGSAPAVVAVPGSVRQTISRVVRSQYYCLARTRTDTQKYFVSYTTAVVLKGIWYN